MLDNFLSSNGRESQTSTPWGLDNIAPMLMNKENYDGLRRPYATFGECMLFSEGGGKSCYADFKDNQAGFDLFIKALEAYGFFDSTHCRAAFHLASTMFPESDFTASTGHDCFVFVSPEKLYVEFFENPQPIVFFAMLRKVSMLNADAGKGTSHVAT